MLDAPNRIWNWFKELVPPFLQIFVDIYLLLTQHIKVFLYIVSTVQIVCCTVSVLFVCMWSHCVYYGPSVSYVYIGAVLETQTAKTKFLVCVSADLTNKSDSEHEMKSI